MAAWGAISTRAMDEKRASGPQDPDALYQVQFARWWRFRLARNWWTLVTAAFPKPAETIPEPMAVAAWSAVSWFR